MMKFSQLKDIIEGSVLTLSKDRPVTHLITDSRKAIIQDGAIFFAISGEHHDGHQYIQTLYEAGVRQFVVEKNFPFEKYSEANFLKVNSAVQALQKIAAHHRAKFSIPVIGITGSNGKTIIKEWLYQLLSKEFTIVKNPGSYNSQIGVPLSVWQIQAHHTLGIFEAGISKRDEMEKLEGIIKPTVGIFTNIGTAHDENFKSSEDKINEKLKLFKSVSKLICCADHTSLTQQLQRSTIPLLTWGFSDKAQIRISKDSTSYSVLWQNKTFRIEFPFSDQASIENAFHCIALML